MTGADTSAPTLTAMVEGPYVLTVMVTASDGQNADAAVSVFAHQPIAAGQSFVHLLSDPGDWVGSGGSYDYTKADAQMTVNSVDGHLSLFIDGDENWNGDFQMPSGFAQFEPGTYEALQRYPFHDPLRGGLDWFGQGHGCNTLTGSFTVDGVTYTSGTLNAIDLRFEQHCEGGLPALHGQIHWMRAIRPGRPGRFLRRRTCGSRPPAPRPRWAAMFISKAIPGDYIGGGGNVHVHAGRRLDLPRGDRQLPLGECPGRPELVRRLQSHVQLDPAAARLLRQPPALPVPQSCPRRARLVRRGARMQHAHRLVRRGQSDVHRQHAHRDGLALRAALRGHRARAPRPDPLGCERRHAAARTDSSRRRACGSRPPAPRPRWATTSISRAIRAITSASEEHSRTRRPMP